MSGSSDFQTVKNLPAMQETDLISRSEIQIALEKGMATHFNVLAWRIPDERGWQPTVGYSPWGHTTEQLSLSDFTAHTITHDIRTRSWKHHIQGTQLEKEVH